MFYRPPEVCLDLEYDHKVDAWSIGVILLEMHVFQYAFPARYNATMIKMYISMMGLPPKEMIIQNGQIRKKVESYFQLPTDVYWEEHSQDMLKLGM